MLRSSAIALILLGAAAAPARAQEASLEIQLSELAPQGAVLVQLFNSEAGYQGGEAVGGQIVSIDGAEAAVRFENLSPGRYAFRMFHDVNGDGEMNTNPFGIPTEPFAFSNNARGRFGPASWEDAAFDLNAGDNTQQITLGGAF